MGRNYVDDHKVAIVCSARSGSTKAMGTTNLLLRAASEALQKQPPSPPRTPPLVNESTLSGILPPDYHVTVDLIRQEHIVAARSSIRDPEILKYLEEDIESDCEWLRNFLLAARVCV